MKRYTILPDDFELKALEMEQNDEFTYFINESVLREEEQ